MKNNPLWLANNIFFILAVLFMFSSGSDLKQDVYQPAKINASGEFIGIIVPPKSGGLKNLRIIDNKTKRIVLYISELTQNRMCMLSKGDYELQADGVKASIFSFQDDCKISSDGKIFKQEALKAPPAVAFRLGQRENITGPLDERFSYYLTILDMQNLDEIIPVSAYSATITGNGKNMNIVLNKTRENNRIISEQGIRLSMGTYHVNISVNGDTKRIPPLKFNVIPEGPFTLTVNNKWNGMPLEYADVQCYFSGATLRPVLSRNEFDAFVYANENNLIKIGGERIVSTGGDGKLVIPGVHNNDRIIFMLPGINAGDDVYTQTRIASSSSNPVDISWNNVPSKGSAFLIQAGIEPNSLESWLNIDNFSVSMFYKVERPATKPNSDVLGDGFTEAQAKYKRENDDTIDCFVDLSKISKVSHFNYLIRVKDQVEGVFIMDNTADEINKSPRLRKEY
jgi:hypothetical protein